jgi:type I restriction enzyme S subunit
MSNNYNLVSTLREDEIPFKLPDNWTWFKWGDLIIDYQQGLIRSNRELNDWGVPYLKMNNLDNNGDYTADNLECTDLSKEEQKRYKLNKGDFLINVRNSRELVGKTCVIRQHEFDMVFNHMLVRIKHQPGISNLFINALLKTPVMRKFIDRCKQGTTTVIALYQRDLYEIPIPIPDLETQNSIVYFINNLSKKLENNNLMNLKLEGIAKTIYDYWFVQFDFPNGKGKPYKTNNGRMVWNKDLKREIPEGWKICKMNEWLETEKTGDWGSEEETENNTLKVNCIRGADINGLNGLGEFSPPARYIPKKYAFKVLSSHDIIIEISGGSPVQSTGRMAFIIDATFKRFENPPICSNFCKAISLRDKRMLYNFAYYWNSLYDNGIFFNHEGKTTGIKNLLFDSFVNSYLTVVPEDSVVDKFYALMQNIQVKKQIALVENQKLIELRDWLLPMLMNGQVKVG